MMSGTLGLCGVEVIAVKVDAVLAKALAVIAGDDNHGALGKAAPLELIEEPADMKIGKADLLVVAVDLAIAK